MIAVSNASPLIVLSGAGLLHFLKARFDTIHITQAIYDEVVAAGKDKPGSDEVARAAKLRSQGDCVLTTKP